jgi:YppG-like protein
MHNPQARQQPMYPPQFPGRFPMGHGQHQQQHMQQGIPPHGFGGPGFRGMPVPFQQPYPPRPFLHSFRTQEGSLDYNKIFAVIDQSVKVAQQISPIFSAFKKK